MRGEESASCCRIGANSVGLDAFIFDNELNGKEG